MGYLKQNPPCLRDSRGIIWPKDWRIMGSIPFPRVFVRK